MNNTDPLMGAKLKFKTHLQNMIVGFLSCFLRVWLQRLKKVLIYDLIFFFFNQKMSNLPSPPNPPQPVEISITTQHNSMGPTQQYGPWIHLMYLYIKLPIDL
jgi:hypothetical protein